MKLFIVDDDPDMIALLSRLLKSAGHSVQSSGTGTNIVDRIEAYAPDCVVLDIMMPDVDGMTLLNEIRRRPNFNETRVVIVSGKPFEFDKHRSFSMGADGYITKPIDASTFASTIEKLAANRITLDFWGVRGTLPVPGEKSLRYGGNTSCLSLEFPSGQFFIFDAGTGIKRLGDQVMAQDRQRMTAKIFISHPHYDHINALPFFAPLYVQGNDFEIIGARHGDKDMRALVSAQMEDVFFPITMREFGARVYFRNVAQGEHDFDRVKVRTMLLSHPGHCLGYRIEYRERSICYVTDNELFPKWTPYHDAHYFEQLSDFVAGADVLITDATYTDEEYKSKVKWGHSCLSEVARLATHAEVEALHLFHHDPGQTDDDIDEKLATTRQLLEELGSAVTCVAPSEGQQYLI
jgi:phosphoribosyl 1,2-cyclic phosphodiesterase/CheY-like chemotaxis protein